MLLLMASALSPLGPPADFFLSVDERPANMHPVRACYPGPGHKGLGAYFTVNHCFEQEVWGIQSHCIKPHGKLDSKLMS